MVRNKPTVAELIDGLDCIDEIDEMLSEGTSGADIAKFLHRTLHLLKDVKERTLANALNERRRQMEDEVEQVAIVPSCQSEPNHEALEPRRSPGRLATGMYVRMTGGMDQLIELEALYLAQRDRIGWMMELESQLHVPLEKLGEEMDRGRKMVVDHAKLQHELGLGGTQGRLRVTLDVTGVRTKFGEKVAKVFANPESRHKVLSLVERVQKVATLPEHVLDVEPEAV